MCLCVDLSEESVEQAYVNVLTRGDLSSLRWIASPLRHFVPSNPNVQLCRVYYASLNFRDIMLATGKLPPDAIPGLYPSQFWNLADAKNMHRVLIPLALSMQET